MDKKRLHQVVDAVAAKYGDTVAITEGPEKRSYKALARRTRRMADALESAGLVPADVVVLFLPPGIAYVEALLATLKAGGVFCPVSPDFPDERVAQILAEARPAFCASDAAGLARIKELLPADLLARGALCMEDGHFTLNGKPESEFPDRQEPGEGDKQDRGSGDDPAYLIATSGSTGTPKLILGVHKGLSHFIHWEGRTFCDNAQPRVGFLTPPTFDVSLRDIFLPLHLGGRLCVPEPGLVQRPVKLVAFLLQEGITHLHLVPSVFRLLLTELESRKAAPPFFKDLKTILFAGEPLYGKDLSRWRALGCAGAELVNLYGPSETTLAKLCHRIGDTVYQDREIVPLGHPIDNSAAMIVKGSRLCRTGEIGEIWIRTPFMSLGYYGRPELTSEAFVRNPFSETPEIAYRSGDMGRYREDGAIAYAGRRDRQLKVNGIRVEPEEIEAVLQKVDGVSQALVLPLADPAGESRIVAYLTPATAPEDEKLWAACAKALPSGMSPAFFVRMAAFPLNFNGKVDTASLPRPDFEAGTETDEGPQGELESGVAEIFKEILGVSFVPVERKFTSMGGNSLAVIRFTAALFRRFSVEMPLADFYATQTVRGVAAWLRDATRNQRLKNLPPLRHSDPDCPSWPLSSAQRRMWVLDRMDGGGAACHVPSCLRVEGPLDAGALESALLDLVRRHEALHTIFPQQEQGPVQCLAEPTFTLEYQDLSTGSEEAAATAELDTLLSRACQRPFDLETGPLFRGMLIRLGPQVHALFLDFHHIVCDGGSMAALTRELGTLYRSHCRNEKPQLPEIEFRYRDFALWQQEFLASEAADADRQYWQSRMAGAPSAFTLPFRKETPVRTRFSGKNLRMPLDSTAVESLRAFGRDAGATDFVLFTAIVKLLLFRYTGQEDGVVGAPVTERPHPGLSETAGFFVNTLPLRDRMDAAMKFPELLNSVAGTVAEAAAHAGYPFDRMVADMGVDRSHSRHPLFQVMVVVHEQTGIEDLFSGCHTQIRPLDPGFSRYDLAFTLENTQKGWVLELVYDTDLFDPVDMNRVGVHLQTLIQSLGRDPELPLAEVSLIPPEEMRLLTAFSAGPAPAAGPESLGAAFCQAARRFSRHIALKTDKKTIRYDELLESSLTLAGGLRDAGLAAGERVAIYLPRGADQITAMLGVFLAGGVYLPIDPVHVPTERAQELIRESGARFAIGRGIPGFSEAADLMTAAPLENPVKRRPEDPAYLIFTSGSTGTPKPVVLAHEGFLSMIWDQAAAFEIKETDKISHILSPGFDAGLFEACLALFSGACLCLVPPRQMTDPARFLKRIKNDGVTVLNTTPSWLAALEKPDPAAIRLIISGGEPPRAEEMRHYLKRGLGWANCYGPTEASVCAAYRLYRPQDTLDGMSLGKPVAGMKIQILDERGQTLPPGIPGEIVLSGPGVAVEISGHVPETDGTGARRYRTGDRGHWNQAGELVFDGRMDNELKLRGFRFHPEEIRQALLARPGVKDAAVGLRGQALTAWVVGPGGSDSQRLHRDLGLRLPAYMLPSAFVSVAGIPLSASGKADIEALPDPEASATGGDRANFTPEEAALAQLWEAVLGTSPASPDADFFASGGSSLSAVRLVARIRQNHGAELPLADLFREPRLSAMAMNLRELRFEIPPAPAKDEAARRLSDAERRIWAMEHLQSGGASAYTIHGAWRIDGPLDVEALKQAMDALYERHSILRAVYREDSTGPFRKILPPAPGILRVTPGKGPADETIPAFAALERSRGMDLEHGPLFRARLLEFDADVHGLVLTLHHIVADGWSMGIIERDLRDLYTAFSRGLTPRLSPLALAYGDAAAWMKKRLERESDPDREYWLQRFAELPEPLDLPADRPRPAVQSFAGAATRLSLGRQGLEALQKLAKETKCTRFMVLYGLVNILLHRHTGARDLVLGCPVAGRAHPLFEDVVGCFVNTLPMRAQVNPALSLHDFMENLKGGVLSDLAHGDYPFDRLVELLPLKRDTSRPPLFNAMMTLADVARDLDWDKLHFTEKNGDPGYSKCDITFSFMAHGDELILEMEYATALFDENRIERMARRFGVLLQEAAARPDTDLASLELMDAAEAAEVAAWSTPVPSGADTGASSAVALFTEKARLRPEAPALLWDDKQLSYGELDEKSRTLARHLGRQGLEKGESVAILARPTGAMVAAVLAVCRAGGVYVPLDPAWPAERRHMILADTHCRFVLADAADMNDNENTGATGAQMLSWDPADAAGNSGQGPDGDRLPEADDLAYIIYTSGSTGKPKGVEVPHRAILRLVSGNNFLQPEPGWRILQTGSLAFDASTYEIWGALANGATLVLGGSANLADPADLAEQIRSYQVSTLFMTTSYFNQMADAPYDVFAGVRHLLTGGERASVFHIREVRRRWPDLRLIHVYGPTENTTFSTYYPLTDHEAGDPPLGWPIRGGGIAVLDRAGNPVPPGVAGEICLWGDGLARGYRNRPDENQARFVPLPGGKGRMYRSGDLGTFDDRGRLCFLGRMDQQVKVRGFRVEPDEVAACISGHPEVTRCLVLARTFAGGTKELVAYVTGGKSADGENLRRYLSSRLPAFMMPSFFVRLESFPLNRNGKIDTDRLPDPRERGEQKTTPGEMPHNDREELLAGIWADVLGLSDIGRRDNFFTLGGDSIKAIAIMARLREAGWQLSVRDLFAAPEIALLAPVMRAVSAPEADETPPGGMTPVQHWFFAKYPDLPAPFHQSLLLDLKEGWVPAHLEAALAALWRCHEMLRSFFPIQDGKRVRRVAPADAPPPFAVVDLRAHEAPGTACGEAMARMEAGVSLESGPLWQPVVYRLPDGDRLHLCAHHLLTDGVSWRILLEDLQRTWSLAEADKPVILPPPATSISGWCRYLAELKTRIPAQEKDFWKTMENAADTEPLPSENHGASQPGTFGDLETCHLQLDSGCSRALTGPCHETFRTRTDELLLAGLLIALSRWRGCLNHALSLESHGRESGEDGPDLSRTVGWLTAIFPVTFRLPDSPATPGSPALHESIRVVKSQLRDVPRRGLGYGLLHDDTDGGGVSAHDDNSHGDTPAISFNYMGEFSQNAGGRFSLLPDTGLPAVAPEAPLMQALSVSALMNGDGLVLSFAWDSRQFTRQTMEALMAGWETALGEIREAAGETAADLSVTDIDYDGLDQAGLDELVNQLEGL